MASQELIGCLKSDGAILGSNWHWPEQKFRYVDYIDHEPRNIEQHDCLQVRDL